MNTNKILATAIITLSVLSLTASHAATPKLFTEAEVKTLIQKEVQKEVSKALGKYEKPIKGVSTVLTKPEGGNIVVVHKDLSGASNAEIAKLLGPSMASINLDQPIGADPAILATGGGQEAAPELVAPREFFSHAISGTDEKGNLKTGIALGMNLGDAWDTLHGRPHTTVQRDKSAEGFAVVEGYMSRLFHRTTLSLATAKGSGDTDKSVRAAVGLSTILYDHHDPRIDCPVEGCEVRADAGLPENASTAQLAKALNELRWLKSGVGIGIAPTFFSPDGNARELAYEGFTAYLGTTWVTTIENFWGGGRIKPGSNLFGMTLHARYRTGEPYAAVGKVPAGEQDRLLVGTRFTYGSNKFNGAIEGGYLSLTGGAKGDENAWRIGGTLSQKVGKNVYLVLTTAQNIGAGDEFFATGGFRIGAEQGTETLAGPTKN